MACGVPDVDVTRLLFPMIEISTSHTWKLLALPAEKNPHLNFFIASKAISIESNGRKSSFCHILGTYWIKNYPRKRSCLFPHLAIEETF